MRALDGLRFFVRFDDGMSGEVDFRDAVGDLTGFFAPLEDQAEFAKVFVNRESGTVGWPNGVELDPVVLHWRATGEPAWVAEWLEETPQPH